MGGFFGLADGASSAPGAIGAAIAYSPPPGTLDPTIAGFSFATGRIKITLTGDTRFQGLPAGTDGQSLFLIVVAGAFTLTLLHLDGLTALKPIYASLDFGYGLHDAAQLFYDKGLSAWVLVP